MYFYSQDLFIFNTLYCIIHGSAHDFDMRVYVRPVNSSTERMRDVMNACMRAHMHDYELGTCAISGWKFNYSSVQVQPGSTTFISSLHVHARANT
jgi:hypothetical protein